MTFQFKIQLKNIKKPPVWRKVVVPSDITFSEFHSIIQVAMGWYNIHLYFFSPSGYRSRPWIEEDGDDQDFSALDFEYRDTISAENIKLSDIFKAKGQTFTYIYDFGDDWEHKITLEEIDQLNISPKPKLIGGKGACPPEDCGGAWGYEDLKEVLSDKNHPDYQEAKEWLFGYNGLYEEDGDEIFEEEETLWNANTYNLKDEQEMFDEIFE